MRWQDLVTPVVLVAFLVGLLVGWLLIGWLLWPVQWTNALPQDLAPKYRSMYVVGVAYTLAMTNDAVRAREAMEGLGTQEDQSRALEEAINASPTDIQALIRLQQLLKLPPAPPGEPGAGGVRSWLMPLLGSLLAVLLIGLAVLYFLAQSGRFPLRLPARPGEHPARPGPELQPAPATGPALDLWPEEEPELEAVAAPSTLPTSTAPATPAESTVSLGQHLGTFTPTYQRGIADYTESFDLSIPDDDTYVGDCGMGVSEALGSDDSRVTALEVWLFDKSDIRTETYVLLSEHAYHDSSLRSRLARYGKAILAAPGQRFTIESKSLRLIGEVHSVEYVDGDAPPHSVFDRVEVRLDVYLKK